MQFGVTGLVQLHKAYTECEYDFHPEQWHPQQITLGLKGMVPKWHDDESPVLYECECGGELADDGFCLNCSMFAPVEVPADAEYSGACECEDGQ
jgi:hypothetical protein